MIAALMLSVWLAQAASGPPDPPVRENRAPVPVPTAPLVHPQLRGIDRTFALAAMQGNNAEMDMARVAMQRGGANEVKNYAGKMLSEHAGIMTEMMPALRRVLRTSAPPQRLAAPDELALRHLQTLSAVDFDQSYAMQQVGDHLAALTAFQTEADNGTDAQLASLARKWLPTIQAHLELAVDLSGHIAGSSPFKSH